jgi:transcription termination factor Rho
MAKTGTTKRRTSTRAAEQAEQPQAAEVTQQETTAVAVEAPPVEAPAPAPAPTPAPPAPAPKAEAPVEKPQKPEKAPEKAHKPDTGGDIAAIDEETNAKYEQVKGGKLYIRDLQKMDVAGLHEIAKQEGIQDYVGLKKQDLIFQILRSRIRQNGLM